MWAIIGGSGFEKFESVETLESLNTNTPLGEASSGLQRIRVGKTECLSLSRHGENHEKLPSEINYRANIFSLKKFGATRILSISAVGSLEKELKPGEMVVPNQYIDRTKSLRNHSFCGNGFVGHCSLAQPVNQQLVEILRSLNFNFPVHYHKTYLCIEGPYFSTQAESKSYRAMGANVIGMTNFPEFALAREAGMSYLPCSFVTDFDCWDESIPHVTIDEVMQVMRENNGRAFELVKKLLAIPEEKFAATDDNSEGLKNGLMTPWEAISADKKQWLEVLRS